MSDVTVQLVTNIAMEERPRIKDTRQPDIDNTRAGKFTWCQSRASNYGIPVILVA